MKKKPINALSLMIVIAIILLSVGCGNGSIEKNSTTDKLSTYQSTEESVYESTDETSSKESKADTNNTQSALISEDPKKEEVSDPLDVLRIPMGFSSQNCKHYVCLSRNHKLYNLTGFITKTNSLKYKIGYFYSNGDVAWLFKNCVENTSLMSGLQGNHIAFGNVPCVEIDGKEEIRGYNATELQLTKVEFYGWSLTIQESGGSANNLLLTNGYSETYTDPITINKDNQHFSIVDKNNAIQSDYHNLTYNEVYTVSWYEGTVYKEIKMKADNPCYSVKNPPRGQYKGDYPIEGTLTKNGYATFDISGVPSGLYMVTTGKGGYSFIKIK